jgi:DNA processing protein
MRGPHGRSDGVEAAGAELPGEEDREARVAWSRLVEPGDPVAGALVEVLGASAALRLVREHRDGADVSGAVPGLGPAVRTRLTRSLAGWASRWTDEAPAVLVERSARLGVTPLVPGDPAWPVGLDDLGNARPLCLWARGAGASPSAGAVALVGARAASPYGEHVGSVLGAGLADAGWTVVSGGAYGIDAVAHRAALAASGTTVAVLAGGLDRPYPVGNARLLAAVAESGTLLSEVPLGWAPTRTRFLQRNRLIAALATGTVVVEAAWRSGALSTAAHAAGLMRPVGAVPGPVTSAASAGCHRLLRSGTAVCVTDVAEVLELVGPLAASASGAPPEVRRTPEELLVLDALPVRGAVVATDLTRRAGLALPDVLGALGTLELSGLVSQDAGRWRRGRGIDGGQKRAGAAPGAPRAGGLG